jgi:hypothetical protein
MTLPLVGSRSSRKYRDSQTSRNQSRICGGSPHMCHPLGATFPFHPRERDDERPPSRGRILFLNEG